MKNDSRKKIDEFEKKLFNAYEMKKIKKIE